MLDLDGVLRRLCLLSEKVYNHLGCSGPADCFCGHGGFWKSPEAAKDYYQNDGETLDFIEAAVEDRIKGITSAAVRSSFIDVVIDIVKSGSPLHEYEKSLSAMLTLLGYEDTLAALKDEHDSIVGGHADVRELDGFVLCRLMAIEGLIARSEDGRLLLP
jgi:hypothetical protein